MTSSVADANVGDVVVDAVVAVVVVIDADDSCCDGAGTMLLLCAPKFCSGGRIFNCGRDKIERKSELACNEFELSLLGVDVSVCSVVAAAANATVAGAGAASDSDSML